MHPTTYPQLLTAIIEAETFIYDSLAEFEAATMKNMIQSAITTLGTVSDREEARWIKRQLRCVMHYNKPEEIKTRATQACVFTQRTRKQVQERIALHKEAISNLDDMADAGPYGYIS